MAYVIGVDTGGTYTDAVLLDTTRSGSHSVLRKAKALTSHRNLEIGIKSSIEKLELEEEEIEALEKVVLSTTLATNAIVTDCIHKAGLILIGKRPQGELATGSVRIISGEVNIKGRVLTNIDREEARRAIETLCPEVKAIAVSGGASVRNPSLEQEVKSMAEILYGIPVICGHELANDLGFWERTNTAVINAGLLPIIDRFIKAIRNVLKELGVRAPVFIVKGDGGIAKLCAIKDKPIETVLSGPAASMIGTINLTQIEDAIICDMGGTTTDTGIVRRKRVELSADGATVGKWKICIQSAKLRTFGLGGDSRIKIEDGKMKIGPKRVLPACRGGVEAVTPTDILHYTGEFVEWNRALAVKSLERQSKAGDMDAGDYVEQAIRAISQKIYKENIAPFKAQELPVCAIGAPAKAWYYKAKHRYAFDLIIPGNYEVAGAVGAAAAGIQETADAVVRAGEEGHGYLVHTESGRFSLADKSAAVAKAVKMSEQAAAKKITEQNLELDGVFVKGQDVYSRNGELVYEEIQMNDGKIETVRPKEVPGKYIETRIRALAKGKIFL